VANSSSSLGIGQWKNFFIYQPWSHGVPLGSLNGGLSSPGHPAAGLGARAATAAIGSAHTIGKLSVPPSWAGATPAIRLAATGLPDSAFAATAAPTMDIPLSTLNQASLGSLTGGALGSPASRVVTSTGVRAKVTAPARRKDPISLDKVIAHLQEQPDQAQHWNVDEADWTTSSHDCRQSQAFMRSASPTKSPQAQPSSPLKSDSAGQATIEGGPMKSLFAILGVSLGLVLAVPAHSEPGVDEPVNGAHNGEFLADLTK